MFKFGNAIYRIKIGMISLDFIVRKSFEFVLHVDRLGIAQQDVKNIIGTVYIIFFVRLKIEIITV